MSNRYKAGLRSTWTLQLKFAACVCQAFRSEDNFFEFMKNETGFSGGKACTLCKKQKAECSQCKEHKKCVDPLGLSKRLRKEFAWSISEKEKIKKALRAMGHAN